MESKENEFKLEIEKVKNAAEVKKQKEESSLNNKLAEEEKIKNTMKFKDFEKRIKDVEDSLNDFKKKEVEVKNKKAKLHTSENISLVLIYLKLY